MPIDVTYMGSKRREIEKARSASSKLMVNALELVDAAMWLIAGAMYGQAITSLHNAIELALKCELEKIHKVLIAGDKQLDYRALKSLFKDSFLQHPTGKLLTIEDYDIDKTITFDEALKRNKDLYPSVEKWKAKLEDLKNLRNNIIHYGHDSRLDGQYAASIAMVAIPFLEYFLLESNDISLTAYLGETTSNELRVARLFCESFGRAASHYPSNALKTVYTAVRFQHVDFPEVTDADGWIRDRSANEFEIGQSLLRDLKNEWNGELIGVTCKICGSTDAYVGIESADDEVEEYAPCLVECARCGLWIRPADGALASIHFGNISANQVDEYLRTHFW